MGALANVIGSLGIFSRLKTSFTAVAGDDVVNKTYGDANYAGGASSNPLTPVDAASTPTLPAQANNDYYISGQASSDTYPSTLPDYEELSKGDSINFYSVSVFTTLQCRLSVEPEGSQRIAGLTGVFTQRETVDGIGGANRGQSLRLEYSGSTSIGWLITSTTNFGA